MDARKNNDQERQQLRNIALVILPLALVAFGWWNVVNTSNNLEDNTIQTYQDAQLEVVTNAGRAAEQYFKDNLQNDDGEFINHDPMFELNLMNKARVTQVEREVLANFIGPIKIGTVGDAWIYNPDYVIFDGSPDFPDIYRGQSMAAIFELQKEAGAFHYEDMTADVSAGESGTGWYVWDPEKAKENESRWEFLTDDVGREIAAWHAITITEGNQSVEDLTPEEVRENTWVIGMSAMLPDLMTLNGAYNQVESNIIQMGIITAMVIGLLFFLLRSEAQVRELRQQVQELKVEIDQSKRAEQVSEIVESEYFQDLAQRAQDLRARNK